MVCFSAPPGDQSERVRSCHSANEMMKKPAEPERDRNDAAPERGLTTGISTIKQLIAEYKELEKPTTSTDDAQDDDEQ